MGLFKETLFIPDGVKVLHSQTPALLQGMRIWWHSAGYLRACTASTAAPGHTLYVRLENLLPPPLSNSHAQHALILCVRPPPGGGHEQVLMCTSGFERLVQAAPAVAGRGGLETLCGSTLLERLRATAAAAGTQKEVISSLRAAQPTAGAPFFASRAALLDVLRQLGMATAVGPEGQAPPPEAFAKLAF